MAWLAIDDTDTLDGGCTTYTAWRLAADLVAAGGALDGWCVDGPLRLVRLAPTIPYKTRGNGALVIPIATPRDEATADEVAALGALVARHLPAPGRGSTSEPQPGAVFGTQAPAARLYQRAVSGPVSPEEAWAAAGPGTHRLTDGPRRGETGALAAAAWPRQRVTYEAIFYRGPGEDGPTDRRVLDPAFMAAIRGLPGGFDNEDPSTGRLRCVPRTPCPVLAGVRGTDALALGSLIDTWAAAPSEPAEDVTACIGAQVFATNHATGDHLRFARDRLDPHVVVRQGFLVTGPAHRARGGHAFVPGRITTGPDAGTQCTLAAYEPTKDLRVPVDALRPGDRLVVLGRTGADPSTVALEAFGVAEAVPRPGEGPSPRCPVCARTMKSMGRGAGRRCRHCGLRAPAPPPVDPPEALRPGRTHQVPDHVRGHLLPPVGGLPDAVPPIEDAGALLVDERRAPHAWSAIARTTS